MKKTYQKLVNQIRTDWAKSDAKRDANLSTPDDILRYDNISYGDYGTDNLLDIYVQKNTTTPQPVIVNIHGGAWVYGSKEVYQYYCMSLAAHGFTVVNFNYRLAPENNFPAPLIDVNNVMHFIVEHGKDYFIDKDKMIVIGDSAGAQIASQYAAIWSNATYASLFEINVPAITIKALGLNCGTYDCKKMLLNKDEMFSGYVGTDYRMEQVDTISHITSHYPPTCIMSTYTDFLFECADPMYQLIYSKGVKVSKRIFGSKDRPDLGHVFNVNLNLPESKEYNDYQCEFFKDCLK